MTVCPVFGYLWPEIKSYYLSRIKIEFCRKVFLDLFGEKHEKKLGENKNEVS